MYLYSKFKSFGLSNCINRWLVVGENKSITLDFEILKPEDISACPPPRPTPPTHVMYGIRVPQPPWPIWIASAPKNDSKWARQRFNTRKTFKMVEYNTHVGSWRYHDRSSYYYFWSICR
jgi:hypothetical protein